jgi:Tol biopolymer transport system component
MSYGYGRVLAISVVAALAATTPGPAHAAPEMGPTRLVSTNAQGEPGDEASFRPLLSADGRFVAFVSEATNLVPGDTNATSDVLVKDLLDGSVDRVSVDEQGGELEGRSDPTSMSADGRHVLFVHYEPVEDSDDAPAVPRLRVADRMTGTSRPIEVRDRAGAPISISPWGRLSGSGRYLAFDTPAQLVARDRDKHSDVYRLDLRTGSVRRVSVTPLDDSGRPGSWLPSISHSGRIIAFTTDARLVRRDRLEDTPAVYVRDMRQGRPRLISKSSGGVQANRFSDHVSVSANGRFVLFRSSASNLVRRDTNRKHDIFVRDRRTGTTKRVSVNSRERQGDLHSGREAASISNDGRFVFFDSQATNLARGTTDFVDPEADGSNLFVRDRRSGTTTAVTMAPDGAGANDTSGNPVISRDGSTVAFFSYATNLVDAGSDAVAVFVRHLGPA